MIGTTRPRGLHSTVDQTLHQRRRQVLWGTTIALGFGVASIGSIAVCAAVYHATVWAFAQVGYATATVTYLGAFALAGAILGARYRP